MFCTAQFALAQLNENCTVSVLNRTVRVNPDGSWVLPNIPANFGQVKARATCVQNGVTTFGESAFFTLPANGVVNLPEIVLGATTQIPVSLTITPANLSFTAAGQTTQLLVTATYPSGSTKNVAAASTGTNYTTSNPAIATIGSDGLVAAVSSGTVVIQATNDGSTGIISASVVLSTTDSDGDGITDDVETDLGMDPHNAIDAQEDFDRDGLTNLREYQLGTGLRKVDSDSDGLSDGDEVNIHLSNPLLTDTDTDAIPDGIEVETGTNPTDKNSYDLKKATSTSVVRPPSFVLTTSVIFPDVSVLLNWKVTLTDGKTTLDLTADSRTTYSSSNINVCNFGAQKGRVFAGSAGSCVITITNSTLSVTVPGTVESFTPSEVSTLSIAGATAVDVGGTFAYITAGSNGLVIVDVSDRSQPRRRGTLSGIGDAQAVRVAGQHAFVGDANGFLRVAQVLNPDAPTLVTSLPIVGNPVALAVQANLVAVAAQSGGVSLLDVTNPTAPVLITTFSVPGSALGVDFDSQRRLAAVAMGSAGLQLVDISNTASPVLRGLLPGGDVRRVLLKDPAALLADVQRSVTSVDITNPDTPVISSSIPSNLGGAPVDIASFGSIAMTADISFGRVVPILNVSNPLQPNTVLFWTLSSPGLSSSVAMDASFGYLITPNTLRIFKYQTIIDTFGIPPTVQITSPANGTQVIQGSTLALTADATDDVDVVSVSFLVGGQVVFTDTTAPYQYNLNVPTTATSMTIGATAIDLGGNVGTASTVTLTVIPDPLTTVTGRVIDSNSAPVSGVTLKTAGGRSGSSGVDGSFSITGVPTVQSTVTVTASFTLLDGTPLGGSSTTPAIRGGITNVGDIRILPLPLITSVNPRQAISGTTVLNFKVIGANLTGSTFSFTPVASPPAITVTSAVIDPAGTSATLSITTSSNAQGTFVARAINPAGSSDWFISGNNSLRVFNLDPTADADGDGLMNADEVARGTDLLNADTDGDGFPDGLEVTLGSDPLLASSLPNILPSGEAVGLTFSVLNGVSPGSGPISTEASSLTFSILNSVIPGGGQPTSTEVNSLVFSILNAIIPGGGQSISTEADGLIFSIQNLATSAPVISTTIGAEGGPSSGIAGSGKGKGSSLAASFFNSRLGKKDDGTGLEHKSSLGFAIVNLGDSSETLTFTAYDVLGKQITGADLTNPVSRTLEPGHQLATLDSELFGKGLRDKHQFACVKLENSSGKTVGFFLMFDEKVTVLDGADIASSPISSFILPEIEDLGFTQVHITNPNDEPVSLSFELRKSDGSLRIHEPVTRSLGAHASAAEFFSDLFPDVEAMASDYIRVTATNRVLPFELFGKADAYIEGLNGQDAAAGATELYAPHFLIGGDQYRSALSVVNLDAIPGTIKIEFIGDDGKQKTSRTIPIAGKGKLHISDQNLFPNSETMLNQGYLKITGDRVNLRGSIVFGDRARSKFSTALPLASRLSESLVLSHVISDDSFFTGLAILNPGDADATVTISLYESDGGLFFSTTEKIPSGHRTAKLLTELFPNLLGQDRRSGYVKIKADRGIVSFAVFGRNDLEALSAIPAQVVP
jgi:hypothetical protein